jgi:hypothetical protein
MTGGSQDPPPEAVTAARAALQRQFPGVVVWYGRATSRWWAFVPIGEWGHLIEATTPEQLAQQIATARSWRQH